MLPSPIWPTDPPDPSTRLWPSEGHVLAFDFGKTRIGIAVGELSLQIAHPLDTVVTSLIEQQLSALSPYIDEWRPVCLIVGHPCYPDGRAHPMAQLTVAFGHALLKQFKKPVAWVDESYTSTEAAQQLRLQKALLRHRKTSIDQLAAREILQTFFEQCATYSLSNN